MSEATGGTTTDNEDLEKKKKSLLEEKNKDDLIKLVKKQLILLQKAKGKSDELGKKCSLLEEANENLTKNERELQIEIEKSKEKITNMTVKNETSLIEKEQLLLDLKERFKMFEKDKQTSLSVLSEKDEQIECLSMQLDTMKKTCQCFQEELTKYQKDNKKMKEEIGFLTASRSEELESLKVQNLALNEKVKEFSSLIDESVQLKKKYNTCIEENCLISSKVDEIEQCLQNLQTENNQLLIEKTEANEQITNLKDEICLIQQKSNQNNDMIFLIADNEKLVKELKLIKNENEKLNETLLLFEQKQDNNGIDGNVQNKNIAQNEEFQKVQEEVIELQKVLCDTESVNTHLRNEHETLKQENQSILLQLKQLNSDKEALESNLKQISREKLDLENEIKKLSVFLQELDVSQMGYEHALLHGAETESFKGSCIKDIHLKEQNEIEFNSSKETVSVTACDESSFPTLGLEYVLLSGGCVPEFFENSQVPESISEEVKEFSHHNKQETSFPSKKTEDDTIPLNELVLLSEKLTSYTEVLKKTVNENESLKLKLELYETRNNKESPTLNEVGINTEVELNVKNDSDINLAEIDERENYLLQLNEENCNLIEKISHLEAEISHSDKNHAALSNEIHILRINLEDSAKNFQDLVIEKTNLDSSVCVLEKQNFELNEKLGQKDEELSNYNSELEILISNVLQIINQDTSNTSILKKNEISNVDKFKYLFNEFIGIFNSNLSAMRNLELDLENVNNQRVELEEKLRHVEELNKFLEEEVKALQDELENFKCNSNYYNKNYDGFYETKCSELYSIEETNETEERTNSSDFLPNNQNFLEASEIRETDTPTDTVDSRKLVLNNDDQICDSEKCTETTENNIGLLQSKMSSLNDSLKNILQEKKILTELNQKQEEELKLTTTISDHEKAVSDLEYKSDLHKTGLRKINSGIDELKSDKCKLNSDMFSLIKEVNVFIKNTNTSLEEIANSIGTLNQENTCLKTIVDGFEVYFSHMSSDFNLWIDSLQQINDSSYIYQIGELKKTFKQRYSNFFTFSDRDKLITSHESLLKNVENFDVNKEQMVAVLCEHLTTSEHSLSELKVQLNKQEVKNTIEKEKDIIQQTDYDNSETIKAQLIDTETKLKKLKQISLRWKKELENSKEQYNEATNEKRKALEELSTMRNELEKVSSEHCHYVQNYQTLQTEYDNTQDELEIQKGNVKKLQEDLATTLLELNSLKENISEADIRLEKSKEMLDATIFAKQEAEKMYVDLEGKLIVAESKYQEKINKMMELESTIKEKQDNIQAIIKENTNLKLQLHQALKDETKKNLLDLEMADYERSVSGLNAKLQTKENEIAELTQELNFEFEKNQSLQEEIEKTDSLRRTDEKSIANLKDILEKTKVELMTSKEEQATLLANFSSLQLQLEIITQQEENCKLQLSDSSAEIQHLKEMIKTSSENHQRIVHSLESKISTQKQDILYSHKEVETIKQDFENYKIRVHSVLRQQKSTAIPVMPVELDVKEKLELMVEKLRAQVKDLSEKYTAVSLEHESLQENYDSLLQRYNKALEEKDKKDSEWHTKLEQINSEKSQLRVSQEELSSQHLLQSEMLVSTYKKQIKIMSDEHKKTVNELQKQLESADLEISRLQRDQQKSYPSPASSQDTPLPFDILSQERQEGEGSECTDGASTPIRHLSLSTIPTSGFMPFEKLLQSPLEPGTPVNFMQCHECEKLIADVTISNKQIDHLSEVLNDSESTNMRMSEQIRVLKEEVRRLERNKEREQHSENLEYLKNVFLKFSTLHACTEKAMLIPVLTTMLKLSPSEQQQLKNVAGDADPNDASNAGWGSYLHRWSGLA